MDLRGERDMKVCAECAVEISTPDGDNLCRECHEDAPISQKRKARKDRKRAIEDTLIGLGLVRVKGALGGTYWE